MSKSRQAARGVIWLAAAKYGIELISFATIAFLARHVAPDEFGVMTFSLMFVMFASLTVETSLTKAVVQPLEVDQEYMHAAFWTQLAMAVVFVVLVGLAGPMIVTQLDSEQIDADRVTPVLLAMLPIVVLNASVGVPTAVCERKLDFRILAIRQLSATLLGGVAGGVAAVLGSGVWALVVQRYTMGLTAFVLLWAVAGYRPRFRYCRRVARRLLGIALPIIAIGFLNFLNTQMTVFAVSVVAGLTALGLFHAANRLLQLIVQSVVGPVQGVGLAAFSQIQNDPARASEILVDIQLIVCAITVPLLMGLAIVAEYLIPTLFGAKWLGSIEYYWLLAPVGLVQSLIIPVENYLVGLGFSRTALKLKFAYIALLAPCLWIGAAWGATGVIFAFTARGFVSLPLIFGATHKCTRLPLARLACGVVSIVSIASVSAAASLLLREALDLEHPGLVASIVLLLASSTLYIVALRFLATGIWQVIFRYFSHAR